MKIAIIGTGNVGSALARGLKKSSHRVVLGARKITDSATQDLAADAGAELASPAEAAKSAELVVLALPWDVAEAAFTRSLGIFRANERSFRQDRHRLYESCWDDRRRSRASARPYEIVAAWLPGARVVKTLNQVGAEIMANNAGMPHRPVMFMAGDDTQAKAIVATVLTDLGFEPLDAGDITKSRLLEPFGMVWINQALLRGKGRTWAFAAMERK